MTYLLRTLIKKSFRSQQKIDYKEKISEFKSAKKEFRKKWSMKFFSPKVSQQPIPTNFFDHKKIRALSKMYENRKNLSRLTMKGPADVLKDYSKFCYDKFQYYEVG